MTISSSFAFSLDSFTPSLDENFFLWDPIFISNERQSTLMVIVTTLIEKKIVPPGFFFKENSFLVSLNQEEFIEEIKDCVVDANYYFTPAIFDLKPTHFCHFLTHFSKLQKLAEAFDLSLIALIEQVNSLSKKNLLFLTEKSETYLFLKTVFNFSFQEIVDGLLISEKNLFLLYFFHHDFYNFYKDDFKFLKLLLKTSPLEILDQLIYLHEENLKKSVFFANKNSSSCFYSLALNQVIRQLASCFLKFYAEKENLLEANNNELLLKMAFHVSCADAPFSKRVSFIIKKNLFCDLEVEGLIPQEMLYFLEEGVQKLGKRHIKKLKGKEIDCTTRKIISYTKSFQFMYLFESLLRGIDFLSDRNSLELMGRQAAQFLIFELQRYSSSSENELGIFFSSGWYGHNVTIVIKKEKYSQFALYIWNTGEHAKKHHYSFNTGKKRAFQNGVCWKGIEEKQIADVKFLTKLILGVFNTYRFTQNIYQCTQQQFKSYSQPVEARFDQQCSTQNYGTCVYSSFVAATACLIDNPSITEELKQAWAQSIRKRFIKAFPPTLRAPKDVALLKELRDSESRSLKKCRVLASNRPF